MINRVRNKVLFVISKLGKGGAQSIVLELANQLAMMGFSIDILLFFRTPQDQTYVEKLDQSVRLVYLTAVPVSISSDFKGFGQRVIQYLKIPFLSVRWVMQGRLDTYDIVHSHLLGASFLSFFFAGLCRLSARRSPAWVETFHADFKSISVTEKQIFRLFWKHLDVLVMELSHKDYAEIASTLPKTAVYYIPFGVSGPEKASAREISTFRELVGETSAKPVIVSIARLNIREKWIDRLLEVIALVKVRHGEDFVFLLCGDGPDGERLREHTKKLGLDKQVRFAGYVDDISRPLGAARTFFVAGIEDLVGIAGLQAAALGVPVVSWQVDPNWHGPRRFFWAEHATDLVAEELCRLLENDDYHRTAAERDQQLAAEHFSVEAMVRGYVGVYGNLQQR